MAIKKQYLKSKPLCRVTFRIPKDAAGNAKKACVVGDFNGWDLRATPLKTLKNGEFSATVTLDVNHEYQFRYVLDQNHWLNDDGADKYISSSYGNCDNSVVVI
ncbi:MAG: isoamylase early set domain-containing protein [Proteobacteria bacterium]|nr:isoamylase early set domain-containing protein [Pseudomonadota bacterium]